MQKFNICVDNNSYKYVLYIRYSVLIISYN